VFGRSFQPRGAATNTSVNSHVNNDKTKLIQFKTANAPRNDTMHMPS